MNVLIIGAGIAGLSCAALLRQRGIVARLVEKAPAAGFNASGYMLGLLPPGGQVLAELELTTAYEAASVAMRRYEVRRPDGRLLHAYPLDAVARLPGGYRGIARPVLLGLLLAEVGHEAIYFGCTATALRPAADRVGVTLSNGEVADFDLVIIADGLHSDTRRLLWAPAEYRYHDTGWGGWVGWLPGLPGPAYQEYWGGGSFLGLYPVRNQTGIFLGGPVAAMKARGRAGFVQAARRQLPTGCPPAQAALDALALADDPYFWPLRDCRASCWRKGRVLLLGDAACGFLPTAGIGAALAMESASRLVAELSRPGPAPLEARLATYVSRQQHRVERAQASSRTLGRLMFVRSPVLAWLRDLAVRLYPAARFGRDLAGLVQG